MHCFERYGLRPKDQGLVLKCKRFWDVNHWTSPSKGSCQPWINQLHVFIGGVPLKVKDPLLRIDPLLRTLS